jgi:glycosyltransferase involved in cell wall biosynthesis
MFKKLLKSFELQKLVVITHALKEYYETNYPSVNGKIQVASDAADPQPQGIRPIKLPNKDHRLQIGYVGHLYKGKGMEVVSQLAELCPWADFHVVGGTEKDITYWKSKCGASGNISFYGHMPHSEVAKYIKAFDVVLLPNQKKVTTRSGRVDIAQWTSPLKAFEYMAAGKPIIASDLSALREIFEHDYNALLCPPDEVLSWQNALKRLQNEPNHKEMLGNNSYNDFVKYYTWRTRAEYVCQTIR